jgi:hypothetical protein
MSGLISRLWPSALVGLSFGRLIGPNLIRTLPTTSSLPPEIIGVPINSIAIEECWQK